MFQVELIWNREFNWSRYSEMLPTLEGAIANAERLQNMGDGASVKKTRVVNEGGEVVWAYAKKVKAK